MRPTKQASCAVAQPTCSTQCRRCTMLVLDRRCERLLRRGRSTPIRHSNVPSDRQLRTSNGSDALSRHRSSLQRDQPIAPHHHRLRGQIAIERAAPSVPHLPRLRALQVCRRRPLVCVAASVMAGIRKPLQNRDPNHRVPSPTQPRAELTLAFLLIHGPHLSGCDAGRRACAGSRCGSPSANLKASPTAALCDVG
jgi:hypothetical protein